MTRFMKLKVSQILFVHNEITWFLIQYSVNIFCDIEADSCLGFNRRCSDVRSSMEVFHLKEWVVRVDRFCFKHIKGGRGQRARFESIENSFFIDDTSSCTIDDVVTTTGAIKTNLRHGPNAFSIHEMTRFIGQIAMDGYVGAIGKECIN